MIDPKEISVVIQGSVNYKYINHATASVREYLPGSEIILSTWDGTDISAVDCDLAVLSEDPGDTVYTIDGDIQNHNRQIRSSKNGLFRATRRYALKLRSDLVLTGAEWLNFFDRFPGRATDYRLTQNRILISNKWTRSCDKNDPCLFHPSDWIQFGTREDVLNYWDIPLSEEPEHSLYLRRHPEWHESPINNDFRRCWTRWYAEQYIYVSFLRKNGVIVPADNRTCWNDELCDLYRRTLVNNFVVLDYGTQLMVKSMKYPNTSRVAINPPCVEHHDWLVYYKKYCDPGILQRIPCNMIDPKEISVVIQGSVNYKYINHATASVREYLPDAEIILSTWEGTDVSAVDCDLAVLSEDPGGAVYSIDGDIQNHNRQIRSSKNGLFRATRRYALKLRSDLVLTGAEWLNFFDRFPGRATDYRLTQNRILISNKWTRSCDKSDPCLFHPSDWIQFGTREDVLNYWDIPLSEEPEHSLYLRRHPERHESPINNDFRTYWTRWCAEQYIYVSFLRKNGVIVPADNRTCWNDELCDLYRRTLVNNFVVLDYGMQLTVKSMKYPDISACYNPPCVEHNDWLVYYKKYCDPALLPVPC